MPGLPPDDPLLTPQQVSVLIGLTAAPRLSDGGAIQRAQSCVHSARAAKSHLQGRAPPIIAVRNTRQRVD